MPSNEVSLTVDFKNVKLVQEIIKKFTDEATRLEERNGILYSHIELLNKALDVLCPLVARTIDFLPSEQFTLIAATREALDNVTYIQNKEYRENTNQDYYKHAEKTALVRLCGVLGVLTENNDLATAALLAATRIESLEKKIPALNVDLAEASMHAYNGEVARMKLEAENARMTAELAELRERTRWIPISENPTKSDWYLIMYQGYRVPDADYYDVEAGWLSDIPIPDYWMPLPELPEEVK